MAAGSGSGRKTKQRDAGAADVLKQSTRERLIDVGERLFGLRGFDGISLREIASSAGQGNSNVVQYHFTDKQGLIDAILADRVKRIEQVRCMQLAILDDQNPINPRQLLKILWLPLMAIRDEDGGHSYCRFMLQYMIHPKHGSHPLASLYHLPFDPEARDGGFPCGRKAVQMLFSLFPGLPKEVLMLRISALATLFLASVVEYDNASATATAANPQPYAIDPILDMAVAALSAPA